MPIKRITLWLMIGALSMAMLIIASNWPMTALSIAAILGSLFYLAKQMEHYRTQLDDLNRLRAAYDQLDQQAKLIIRTDVELHRTQEELDRRLASLMSLHQLGQQLQVNLRPDEGFGRLDATIVTNFGFSKGVLGTCPSFETIEWRSLIGVSQLAADALKRHLLDSQLLKHILTNPLPTIDKTMVNQP